MPMAMHVKIGRAAIQKIRMSMRARRKLIRSGDTPDTPAASATSAISLRTRL